jgi:hypothetical protein
MPSLTLPSASLTVHGPPSNPSTASANEEALFIAPSSCLLSLAAPPTRATMGNSLAALCNLPAAAKPRASHAVSLGNKPGAPSPVFTTSSGERLRFSQIDGQWRAVMQAGYGVAALQRTLPVVSPTDVSNFLSWLRGQDKWTSRARIHILEMPQAPYGTCVYLGRAGLLGGVPASSHMAFGEAKWKQHFGEVGPAPDLPSDIDDILDSTCPFWPGRKIRDTHLLVLIPAKVNSQPFSLNLLRELIQNPQGGGHRAAYSYYTSDVRAQLGTISPSAPYWLLMTRDVLPGSRDKTYADQQELIAAHASHTSLPYELPKALEVATVILTHHVRNGTQLYSNNPWTYARCQELIHGEYPATVGGFESSGLLVSRSRSYGSDDDGVAGCLRFCVEVEEDSKPLATAFGVPSLYTLATTP